MHRFSGRFWPARREQFWQSQLFPCASARSGIVSTDLLKCAEMCRCLIPVLLFVVSLAVPLAAVDGTFQGRVIDPPSNQPLLQGWIYVQGRNHMVRRVEVSHAKIVFGEDVRVSRKHKCGMDCLTAGEEIRVIAEQDPHGEWRAKRVEILSLTANRV